MGYCAGATYFFVEDSFPSSMKTVGGGGLLKYKAMNEVVEEEVVPLERERGKGKRCVLGSFFFVCTYKHDAPSHPAHPTL